MDGNGYRELMDSWQLAMHAAGRDVGTQRNYMRNVRQFLDWCEAAGVPADLTAPHSTRAWLAALRDTGMAGSTRQLRLASLRSYAKWLEAEEGEHFGLDRIEWPKIDETIPDALTPADIDRLAGTCDAKTFVGSRDIAIIRLLFDAMIRADELLSMDVSSVDLKERSVRVRRGKGGRERVSSFGAVTAQALDRYQRRRKQHKASDLDAYWLALGRGPLRYPTLYVMISRRAERAGVANAHPHAARAGGSVEWRRAGGSAESLMTLNGWKDPKMVMRYTRAAEIELAREEAKRLGRG